MNTPRQIWLFQANPNRYKIEDSLFREEGELWNLNQHADEIQEGDRVLIWMSGPQAGVYAVGTVVGDPIVMADSPEGQTYWVDPTDGRQEKPRVPVRYDRVMMDRPLLKAYLIHDPELDGLAVIRQPRGTNYRVTAGQWQAIMRWMREVGALEA